LFKYASPYFFLKDVRYGNDAASVYRRLNDKGLQVAFVSDIKYHQKSVFFLKNNGTYVLGLVPYNMNP